MLLKKIKIGNLLLESNVFVAPLAGYTNLPTRLIYRRQKCGIAYAEMVSAMGLKCSYNKSLRLIDTNENDEPLGVQLFGSDSGTILDAFLKIKNEKYDLIDINCGCSIRKVLKSNAGACLLRNPDEIYRIIKNIKDNTDKPVTLKIRSGWDNTSINFLEVLDSAINAKAELITFHPRTRSMIFQGKSHWDYIRIMKEKSTIPVIGNGDIFCSDDAVRMMDETGCDGVMIARGLIDNPFLIEEIRAAFMSKEYILPSTEKRIDVMLDHCKLMADYFGEKKGIIDFRKYIRGYTKGLKNISDFRKKINYIESYEEFKKTVNEYLKESGNN